MTNRSGLGAVLVATTAVFTSVNAGAQDPGEPPVVQAIVHANVVPMDRERVLRDHTVVIHGDRIVSVGPSREVVPPKGARIVDAAGRYLLPGLVDAHVHVRAESELRSYLQHGVTTVINMRGTPEHLALRGRIERGEVVGPTLYTTGPLLDGDPPIWTGSSTRVVTGPEAAPRIVGDHVEQGYDLVKVYNNLAPAALSAVVHEAHAAGLGVVGHLPRRPVRKRGLRVALAAGLDMIAHGEEIFFTHLGGAADSLLDQDRYVRPSETELREVALLVRDAGAAVTPNLSFIAMTARMLDDIDAVFSNPLFERLEPGVREMWREQNPTRRSDLEAFRRREVVKYRVVRRLTRILSEEDVPLLAGTDASAPGLYPGFSLHVELRELSEAGLPPFEVLVATTRAPNRFLTDHVPGARPAGIVAVGRAADLILVDGNPLENLDVLSSPDRVMSRGRWVVR